MSGNSSPGMQQWGNDTPGTVWALEELETAGGSHPKMRWERIAPLPGASPDAFLPPLRLGAAACMAGDGRHLFVMGGYDALVHGPSSSFGDAWVFDAAAPKGGSEAAGWERLQVQGPIDEDQVPGGFSRRHSAAVCCAGNSSGGGGPVLIFGGAGTTELSNELQSILEVSF